MFSNQFLLTQGFEVFSIRLFSVFTLLLSSQGLFFNAKEFTLKGDIKINTILNEDYFVRKFGLERLWNFIHNFLEILLIVYSKL